MITPFLRILGQFSGRVADAYVQGSPKGGGAWTVSASSYHGPALVERFKMRLQFDGTYSLEEFEDAISRILNDFKSSKIDSLRSINIYVQPCVKGRVTRLVDGEDEIEHLIFGLSHPQQVALSSDNLSVVAAYKPLSPKQSGEGEA